MLKSMRLMLLISVLFVIASTPAAYASWAADGIPVALQSHLGGQPEGKFQIAPDGSGGAIITWVDDRSGEYDIYAQRVDDLGSALWTADGVLIGQEHTDLDGLQITADGAGGAIFTWEDKGQEYSDTDIFATRFNSVGTELLSTCVCSHYECQMDPVIATDGAGCAIVAWADTRHYLDIFAQQIDASGDTLW